MCSLFRYLFSTFLLYFLFSIAIRSHILIAAKAKYVPTAYEQKRCLSIDCQAAAKSTLFGGCCIHCTDHTGICRAASKLALSSNPQNPLIQIVGVHGVVLDAVLLPADKILFHYQPANYHYPNLPATARKCRRFGQGNEKTVRLEYILAYRYPVVPGQGSKRKNQVALSGKSLFGGKSFEWDPEGLIRNSQIRNARVKNRNYQVGFLRWVVSMKEQQFFNAANVLEAVIPSFGHDGVQPPVALFEVTPPTTLSRVKDEWLELVPESTCLMVMCLADDNPPPVTGAVSVAHISAEAGRIRNLLSKAYNNHDQMQIQYDAIRRRASETASSLLDLCILDDAALAVQEASGVPKGVTQKCAKAAKNWLKDLAPALHTVPPPKDEKIKEAEEIDRLLLGLNRNVPVAAPQPKLEELPKPGNLPDGL